MNIVQIRYTKYHSSGDKAQINIYIYIYLRCAWYCKKKERKDKTKHKRHCTNNNKKYINKERETRGKKKETEIYGGIEMNCTHTNRVFRSTKQKKNIFFLSYITTAEKHPHTHLHIK